MDHRQVSVPTSDSGKMQPRTRYRWACFGYRTCKGRELPFQASGV